MKDIKDLLSVLFEHIGGALVFAITTFPFMLAFGPLSIGLFLKLFAAMFICRIFLVNLWNAVNKPIF